MTPEQTTHWMLTFAALYLSEAWYSAWQSGPIKRLHYKARAVVLFDRALNLELDVLEAKGGKP